MAKNTKKAEETVEVQETQVETPSKIRIMNRGKRAFYVKPESCFLGHELTTDKARAAINSGSTVDIEASVGEWLVKNFPSEILKIG